MRAGLSMLPEDAWETEANLAILLTRDAAECAYLTGDYALSDTLVEGALGRAIPLLQRLDLHNLRIVSATARAAWPEALDARAPGARGARLRPAFLVRQA